jgi:hypothetical protein
LINVPGKDTRNDKGKKETAPLNPYAVHNIKKRGAINNKKTNGLKVLKKNKIFYPAAALLPAISPRARLERLFRVMEERCPCLSGHSGRSRKACYGIAVRRISLYL